MEQHDATHGYLRLARRVLVHRWGLILTVFALVAVPTIAWTSLTMKSTYEASTTLFLLPENSESAVLRDFVRTDVHALYHVMLRSRSVAQAVVEALPKESRDELSRQLGFRDYVLVAMNQLRRWRGQEVVVYSPTELAVRELQEARTVFSIGKDGTVTITATAFSPRVAVDLANTYVEVLLSRSSAFARQQARGTRELLESFLTQARSSQAEAEEALRKVQAQGGAVKLPDESRLDLQRLSQLESSLADVQVSREIAQARLQHLKGDRKAGSPPVVDLSTQPLRERLAQMEAKLAALNEKYTPQHPLVQAAQADVREAQERLKNALQGGPGPSASGSPKSPEQTQYTKQAAELEVEVLSLQTREQQLQHRLQRLKQSMSTLSSRELEYAGLVRSVETQMKLSAILTDKLTTARMSEQGNIRGIQVIDLAALPRQPSAKQPLKLILLGLLGGLGLGLAAGTLREYALQVVEVEHEIAAATGLMVLGSIPMAPQLATTADSSNPTVFVASHDPHSLPADACRAIRTAIDCDTLDRPIKTLLVTSASAHEGKTTVLLNLALAYVDSGRRVLVIDADLRRPSVHRVLGVPNESGLADVLQQDETWPAIFYRVAPGLECLPSGVKVQNPGSLLSSRHMTRLLELARQRADIVLIDSPPVLAVSDCLPLIAQVDGVLLVARFGATQRRSLVRAKALLDRVGARLMGAVLNGLSPRETRRQYAEYTQYVSSTKPRRTKEPKR